MIGICFLARYFMVWFLLTGFSWLFTNFSFFLFIFNFSFFSKDLNILNFNFLVRNILKYEKFNVNI
jgi:hypothetical protein